MVVLDTIEKECIGAKFKPQFGEWRLQLFSVETYHGIPIRLKPATVVMDTPLEGVIPYQGDSVDDLWSQCSRARVLLRRF